jgi:hypothetical protein
MAADNVASVTATVTRTHGGMPNWCLLGVGLVDRKPRLFWPYTSSIGAKRFLTRFIIVRNPLFSVDVTRIHMPDDSEREWPHDHSRDFWSFKAGWYEEWVYGNPDNLEDRILRKHSRFSVHRLRHTQAHSITRVSPRLVTVLFLGRSRQKSNYWTPSGFQTIGMKVDQDAEVA